MCSASSPRAAMLYYAGCEEHQEEPHFLQSCFLCNKPLGFNCDIFMYRGDTAFCSKECRQEQIEIDEAKERKSRKLSFSSSFSSSSSSSSTSTTSAASASSNSSRNSETKANKTVRTGTVAVA